MWPRQSTMQRASATLAVLAATMVHAQATSIEEIGTSAVGRGSFDCKNIKASTYTFDLSGIKFPLTISNSEETPPTTTRTQVTIDLCAPLSPSGNGPANEQCPKGTRICMRVINDKKGEGERVTQVIPAAGGSSEDGSDWSTELGEHLESAERVLQIEMHGDYYGERRQKTEINMRCDKQASKDAEPTLKKYDRLDGTLKLDWRTPHACATHMGGAGDSEDNNDKGGQDGQRDPPSSQSGGWGFFSWFFFLIFFGGIAYVLIGVWRSYNEYGVIELPHRDFWREAPYIAKDMGRHIYSTVSGQGGSRGAYEPV